jgi:hypothetical protein
MLFIHLRLGLPRGLLPSGFPSNFLYSYLKVSEIDLRIILYMLFLLAIIIKGGHSKIKVYPRKYNSMDIYLLKARNVNGITSC